MSINRVKWQTKLFSNKPGPRRSHLVALQPDWPTKIVKIKVFRNETGVFEAVSDILRIYMQYMGLTPEFSYSAYDSSLSWDLFDEKYDHAIFFITDVDPSNFQEQKMTLLNQRVKELEDAGVSHNIIIGIKDIKDSTAEFKRKIQSIVYGSDFSWSFSRKDDFILDLSRYLWGKSAVDRKKWSNLASLIYSNLFPRAKAIITDLDGTLHAGVVGEREQFSLASDTDVLCETRNTLKAHFKTRGIILNIASKNEIADIEAMFSAESDDISLWPHYDEDNLKRQDFAIIKANWGDKSEAIKEICKELNISTDDVVFLDDNIGVLAEIAQALPGTRLVWQDQESSIEALTCGNLSLNYKSDENALIRTKDISANFVRKEGMAKTDRYEYLRSIAMDIDFCLNAQIDIPRIAELEQKTNQFNFNFTRFNETQLTDFFKKGGNFLTFDLSDSISESGIIGHILFTEESNRVVVNNIVISCRALGRNVEDFIIHSTIDYLYSHYGKLVYIDFKVGPKNKPAQMWLTKEINTDKEGLHLFPRNEKAKNEWNFKLGIALTWVI